MGPDPDLENGKYKQRHRISLIRILGVALVIVGFSLIGLSGYKAWQKSNIIIPVVIKKQVSFVIFWPQKPASVNADKTTIKYDPANKLLTYIAHTTDGARLIVSQQPTPDTFNDIPQYYPKFIESLQQYGTFGSLSGIVYLTHPKELKGGQTAVMNSKGTLMLIKPDKAVSDDTWRRLFNNMQIIP